jgi:hypothetical protein
MRIFYYFGFKGINYFGDLKAVAGDSVALGIGKWRTADPASSLEGQLSHL